jgi:peroxiredoxin
MNRFALALFLMIPAMTAGGGSPADRPATGPATGPREQYQALVAEFDAAAAKYDAAVRAATTDAEREAAGGLRHGPEEFTHRFLAVARRHPADPAAVDALVWIAAHDPAGPEGHEAMAVLARDHAGDDRLAPACDAVRRLPDEAAEAFLRAVAEKSPHRDVRARALYGLAVVLKRWTDDAADLSDPESRRGKDLADFYGGHVAERVRKDAAGMAAEAERAFEQVRDRYAGVRDADGPLAEAAGRALYEMRNLAVGKPAPDVAGHDMDGRPLRLSEYRGRVVVLTFWATWCPPCMRLVPHERALAARLASRPFALLGVNADDDRDRAGRVTLREGMTWPSWADGGRAGPIARQWDVTGWPTVYVLDRDGVIRHKWVGAVDAAALDKAVDDLLK